MRIYRMPQQIERYVPECRKSGAIEPIGSKIPTIVWSLLLFLSFMFSGVFVTKMTINSYTATFADMFVGLDLTNITLYTLVLVSLLDMIVLYCQVMIYNFIARWYLRGEIPLETSELYKNLVPFFVLRNAIWGVLSLLMFIEGGIFVAIGLYSFEHIATMIIFFPAFYAIKKRYIKQGYSKAILQAYAVPYIIFICIILIF